MIVVHVDVLLCTLCKALWAYTSVGDGVPYNLQVQLIQITKSLVTARYHTIRLLSLMRFDQIRRVFFFTEKSKAGGDTVDVFWQLLLSNFVIQRRLYLYGAQSPTLV